MIRFLNVPHGARIDLIIPEVQAASVFGDATIAFLPTSFRVWVDFAAPYQSTLSDGDEIDVLRLLMADPVERPRAVDEGVHANQVLLHDVLDLIPTRNATHHDAFHYAVLLGAILEATWGTFCATDVDGDRACAECGRKMGRLNNMIQHFPGTQDCSTFEAHIGAPHQDPEKVRAVAHTVRVARNVFIHNLSPSLVQEEEIYERYEAWNGARPNAQSRWDRVIEALLYCRAYLEGSLIQPVGNFVSMDLRTMPFAEYFREYVDDAGPQVATWEVTLPDV